MANSGKRMNISRSAALGRTFSLFTVATGVGMMPRSADGVGGAGSGGTGVLVEVVLECENPTSCLIVVSIIIRRFRLSDVCVGILGLSLVTYSHN